MYNYISGIEWDIWKDSCHLHYLAVEICHNPILYSWKVYLQKVSKLLCYACKSSPQVTHRYLHMLCCEGHKLPGAPTVVTLPGWIRFGTVAGKYQCYLNSQPGGWLILIPFICKVSCDLQEYPCMQVYFTLFHGVVDTYKALCWYSGLKSLISPQKKKSLIWPNRRNTRNFTWVWTCLFFSLFSSFFWLFLLVIVGFISSPHNLLETNRVCCCKHKLFDVVSSSV